MFSFVYNMFKGTIFGLVVMFALPALVLSLLPEAKGGELRCREGVWGDTVCRERGVQGRYVIKENIWQEHEVRKNGKLIARCRKDVFGELVCRERR